MKLVKPTTCTLSDAFDAALLLHYKGRASAGTVSQHRAHILAALPAALPLANIGIGQYRALVAARQAAGNAPATINRIVATLHKVMALTHSWGMWAGPVPTFPALDEPAGRIRVFTHDEEATILGWFADAGRPEMVDLCTVLVDTGLRLGEALKWDCVEVVAQGVRVWRTKNRGERTVPLTPAARAALVRHLKARSLDKDGAEYRWKLMRRALGHEGDPEFVIHAFRHTCCTRLLQAGMDVAKAQLWMGHRDIQTTLRYTHLCVDDIAGFADKLVALRGRSTQ